MVYVVVASTQGETGSLNFRNFQRNDGLFNIGKGDLYLIIPFQE